MDRRKSLKVLATTAASTGLFVLACKQADKKSIKEAEKPGSGFTIDRTPEEAERDSKLLSQKFFTAHEMATITILADIIIPDDGISGSASEAEVPAFINFIVQDMPQHQIPMRGGLRWLDIQCSKLFGKAFADLDTNQRIQMVDQIAYPEKAKPGFEQGAAFFSLMRNLTATGFYTSKIGISDVGYQGNKPNKWTGVPDDVLKQYGLAYSEKEIKECI